MSATPYHYRHPNATLLDAFHINERDIQLNRTGHISASQQRHIWLDRLPPLVGFASAWLFVLVMYLASRVESFDASSANLLGGVMMLLFFGFIGMVVRAFRIMAGLSIETAVGIGKLERREGRYGGWFLYVDGRTFELKSRQYHAIPDNTPLAVYYIDRRKRILSVEQVVFEKPQV